MSIKPTFLFNNNSRFLCHLSDIINFNVINDITLNLKLSYDIILLKYKSNKELIQDIEKLKENLDEFILYTLDNGLTENCVDGFTK